MDMTLDELAAMLGREFSALYKRFDRMDERFTQIDERFAGIDQRFDRLESRTARIEEIVEEHSGKLSHIDDRLARIEFTLHDANPRDLARRVERLEAHALGSAQPA